MTRGSAASGCSATSGSGWRFAPMSILQVASELAYLALGDFADHAVALLHQADEVFEVAVGALEIVVGDLRPALFELALDLVPVAGNRVDVHVQVSSGCAACRHD